MHIHKTLDEHAEEIMQEAELLVSSFLPLCYGQNLAVTLVALISTAHRLLEANGDESHVDVCAQLRDMWCGILHSAALEKKELEEERDLN